MKVAKNKVPLGSFVVRTLMELYSYFIPKPNGSIPPLVNYNMFVNWHIASASVAIMSTPVWAAILDEKRGVISSEAPTAHDQMTNSVSIGIFALGYVITYLIAVGLIIAHVVHMVRRNGAEKSIVGAKVTVADERLTQSGYMASSFGNGLRVCTLLFAVWLQVAIIISIIGHYNGVWVFDMSIPKGAADWDSYTRVFLMAWSASILMAITARVFQNELRTFYMMPTGLKAASYVKMTQVLVDNSDPSGEMSVVHQEVLPIQAEDIKHVDFLLRRYTWSEEQKLFVPGKMFRKHGPTGSEVDALKRVGGLTNTSAIERYREFGRNEIILSIPSLFKMTVTELSSFFYLYQIAACWLPFYWDYITVGFMTLILVLASAMIKIYMEHKGKLMLKDMATLHGTVWTKRDGSWTKLTSESLAVGDLICLTASTDDTSVDLLADCLVVSGSCVVDEASLTGETMPIQKFPCPVNEQHRHPDEAENKKYYLFAGTAVLQANGTPVDSLPLGVTSGALAIITATGANTSRGDLMRGLIFGASLKSTLYIELRYSLGILVLLALIDFLSLNGRFQMSLSSMLTAMYSIIGLINHLISAALVAGQMRSADRLKANNEIRIFTRDLHRLTIAGKVDIALLDKTGTITKSGLDMYGVIPVTRQILTDVSGRNSDITAELSAALALAHSVSRCNNQLIGHQVELRMVETAKTLGWNFADDMKSANDPSGQKWSVQQLFPFSHETMTMSAIVSNGSQKFVLCKGSIEAIKSRCTGIPAEMSVNAEKFAKDGCYVLGVGLKRLNEYLPLREREDLETELDFTGLLLFRNEVKSDSRTAISELQAAGVRVGMMTGDSVFTGATVARNVGIIPSDSTVVIGTINPKTRSAEYRLADSDLMVDEHALTLEQNVSLCITGELFADLYIRNKLNLDATRVYGRVSPHQKAEIVKLYSNSGKVVAMCGDGANDSSGLRSAHAGLALSGRTEASISAPFSTDSDSLRALTLLVREARSALCTSLASYQSLVVVGILYCISKSILLFQATAYQAGLAYLYLDLLTTPLMLYGLVQALPASKLASEAPEGSLIGGQLICSSIWSVLVCISFLALADLVMVDQSWFVPFVADAGVGLEEWQKRGNNFEAALIFVWSAWVYIDIPLTYSTGGVHRAPVYTNWRLMLVTAGLFATTLAVLFTPAGEFGCYFKVSCNAEESSKATGSFINSFLFPYERVGGTWYNSDIESTEFPTSFKVVLFFILVSMSIAHHAGHHFITKNLPKHLGKFSIRRKAHKPSHRNAGQLKVKGESGPLSEFPDRGSMDVALKYQYH